MSKELETPLSLSDCLCNICMEIFLEPVTLPCQHTLCKPCFQLTVEKASLCCPFCRRRVSSWARHNVRKNTLINLKLWETIQKFFPEECKRRLNGQDQEEEEDVCVPQPVRCLSKPGELRQEYEAEITKVEEERRAHEQEESKASEEYIRKLLAEEEEQQRLAEEMKKQMEEQLLLDERLARELSLNLNSSSEKHTLSTLSPGPSPLNSCKSSKSKSGCSGDIKRYLSPKSCSSLPPVTLSNKLEEESNGSFSGESSSTKNSFICGEEKEDEMPTLTPQILAMETETKDSFLEPLLPQLNICTKDETTTLSLDLTCLSTCQGNELAGTLSTVARRDNSEQVGPFSKREAAVSDFENDKFVGNMDLAKDAKVGTLKKTLISVMSGNQQNSCHTNCNLVMENSPVGNINPSRSLIEISLAKRKSQESSPEAAVNSHLKDKRRKTLSQTSEDKEEMNEIQQQMSLEQKCYERFKQEQQDKLLALKLQKEMDKEEKILNRKKGSPDEYHLRPKTSQSEHASPVSCKLLQNTQPPSKKTEADQRKHRRSSRNENSKPSNKRQPKPPGIKGNVLNSVLNSSDSKEVELLSNKQKTILQMFKRSATK
uniref:E3 ubiquitin-protein ligase RNF168 n=1 Tax=Euleptes europaea TaxID=460621 RepID=UPI0025410A7F|nr:E3 ubiquitin-protein ligase RNF168 [Euleptes europaea]